MLLSLLMRHPIPPKMSDYTSIRLRAHDGQRPYAGSSSFAKVSVITVVRNGEKTLSRTIDSIRTQTYPNIEYIVVDGASTDQTLSIILDNLDAVSRWITEPDGGIYDAFNKGVALATGQYIAFLNADDTYSSNQIDVAVASLEKTGCLWAFGDTWLYDYYGQDVFLRGDQDYDRIIRLNMPSIHQVTVLAHRAIFDIVGLFRTTYRIAADYDWFIRVAMAGIRGVYNSEIVGHMWAGGISTSNQKLSIRESFLICVRNGHPILEACVFWLMRYLHHKHEAPPEFKERINAIRAKLQRLFGSASAVPSDVTATVNLWDDVATKRSAEEPHAGLTSCAFAAGRHAGTVLKEAALLYFALLAGETKTYAIIGSDVGVRQAEAIFLHLSVQQVPPSQADIIVIGKLSGYRLPWKHMKARYLAMVGDFEWTNISPGWSILGALPGLLMLRRTNTTDAR
jgi:glycosyltransferase involved in cell wall biosynthesis